MKILQKAKIANVVCRVCECKFEIKDKDWRRVDKIFDGDYKVYCPNCLHPNKIIPGEIKCKK